MEYYSNNRRFSLDLRYASQGITICFKVKNRVWIEGDSGTFLGEGRARLLENIEQFGSITEAAKNMNMSYRKAWNMVDIMNKQSSKPLVEKSAGGIKGGGANVTDYGFYVLKIYKEVSKGCRDYLNDKMKNYDLEP